VERRFFASASAFRAWLDAHHDSARELLVGFYNRQSARTGITYREALDQALCYGWIDGVRKKLDEHRYTIRFTPRTPKSAWSSINIRRATELRKRGLMAPPGLKAFNGRDRTKAPYSYEHRATTLTPALQPRFEANRQAWEFFIALPPGYRKTVTWWVMSAVKDETRLRRLQILIDECARGRRIDLMAPARGRRTP
jgi:uncharacterized protein YdeI (YjbR/CyaY-like superfamily)